MSEEMTVLDFCDVLLRPKRSNLSSRREVLMEREFLFKNSGQRWKGVPILTSNMDTVGTFEMYNVLSEYHMITCFHKYYEPEDYPTDLNKDYYMVSTGIKDEDFEKLQRIVERIDPKFICVDVANGYMYSVVVFLRKLRQMYPTKVLVCGNVVTREMVSEYILNCGVDIVKVGIGSGSCCTTRLQTGVGMPQYAAVKECADPAHAEKAHIISDGGIREVGDISKALGAGADFVMMGSMFAGHTESGGVVETINDKQYKVFYGMSSSTAMKKYHGGVASYRSSEGKTVRIPFRGPVENTLHNILGGIRSTCTYIGAHAIKDMSKCSTFMKVNRQANNIYNKMEV